jgi:hypothetical protein
MYTINITGPTSEYYGDTTTAEEAVKVYSRALEYVARNYTMLSEETADVLAESVHATDAATVIAHLLTVDGDRAYTFTDKDGERFVVHITSMPESVTAAEM